MVEDRIFFRRNGVVDWIEAIVADRDGQVHTVQEVLDQLGYALDQVYVNSNLRSSQQFDVLAGPDQIYVWAECGLAVGAVSPLTPQGQYAPTHLTLRHPVHPDASLQPAPASEGAILFEFFFPPTSFAGFESRYQDRVPFWDLIWHEYLRRVNQSGP